MQASYSSLGNVHAPLPSACQSLSFPSGATLKKDLFPFANLRAVGKTVPEGGGEVAGLGCSGAGRNGRGCQVKLSWVSHRSCHKYLSNRNDFNFILMEALSPLFSLTCFKAACSRALLPVGRRQREMLIGLVWEGSRDLTRWDLCSQRAQLFRIPPGVTQEVTENKPRGKEGEGSLVVGSQRRAADADGC